MTIKTLKKISSELALVSRDSSSDSPSKSGNSKQVLTPALLQEWASLPESIRAALVSSELSSSEVEPFPTPPHPLLRLPPQLVPMLSKNVMRYAPKLGKR